ncbi:MAG TPA: hypothetical protein VFG69_17690, partial [Nannocystaceae bacterium]|nr:hypothetical protein [Nannocystaceae bacterium]
ALVQAGPPSAAELDDHIANTLATREDVRTHAVAVTEALHSRALLGDAGVDGGMPDDATLERAGRSALPRSWNALRRFDPDVLYVGPRPERLRELLPTPTGSVAPTVAGRTFRQLDRPTVFLLEDPGRESADIRVALVPTGTDARARLLGELFEAYPAEDPAPDGTPSHPAGLAPIDFEFVRGRMVFVRGYRCAATDVPRVVAGALRRLRLQPTREGFAIARGRLESLHRGYRIPSAQVPSYVRIWPALGTAVDPRLEPWLALGGIDFEAFTEYVDGLADIVPIVSIVAAPETLDDDALALHGQIVRIPVDALLRDPMLDDSLLFAYPAE